MFNEILGIIKDFLSRVIKSRLFPVMIIFCLLFFALILRLFRLQIIESEQHQKDYVQMTLSELTTDAVRGNIYDKNGTVLAYDQMVYSVTLKDIGYYEKHAQKNQMILELIHLLDECKEDIVLTLPIGMADKGDKHVYTYTTTSAARKKQFLRDLYGIRLDQLDDESGKYPSDISADKAMEILKKRYYFEKWLTEDPDNVKTISDYDALRVVNVRYALAQNVYKKYLSITVASNVSEETMSTIKENSMNFKGVDIEEDYVRIYPDGDYFAQIIGYTGIGSTEEIDELKAKDPSYEYGDTIGKSGIEALMETELSGKKGTKTVYLDSTGKVLEVLKETPAVVGNDVYLTIDHDLTIASYKLLEQEMASIILTYLVREDAEAAGDTVKIPVKKVYFQLFNNNIISLSSLSRNGAPWWEGNIRTLLDSEMESVIGLIKRQLYPTDEEILPPSDAEKRYIDYFIDYICNSSELIDKSLIDTSSESYKKMKDGSGSVRDFLYSEIYRSEAVNLSLLVGDGDYYSSDKVYELLCDELLSGISTDNALEKLIVENLIYTEKLDPYLICLTLYSQGIISTNNEKMTALTGADKEYCYNFISECIAKIQITPAQLALDPCNGSVVITDVESGKVSALVSYPGYDNNHFSGSVDATYYKQLLSDQSNPLFNYATQARSAPGSTFKMLSAIAALECGIMDKNSTEDCTGIFDIIQPSAKCWIYTQQGIGHGEQNVVQALANSCNYYFYTVGYKLSLEEDGTYNPDLGLEKLTYYAKLLGLGQKSGIELNEYAPQISTEYPVMSAIGQATNNYTPVVLSRYVTAIASKGNLYDLTLLDHVNDKKGSGLFEETKNISHIDEISASTWESIWEGMYEVTHSGTVASYFKNSNFNVSGKTGSAQEDLTRPNHALFVSFGPSEDPEITVTVSIRNGYSSGYSAAVANDIYNYYFGYTTLDYIKSLSINQDNSSVVGD